MKITNIYYKTTSINKQRIFYREAGSRTSSTILLLHGFPSSSHMFRDLIPILATNYHVIAPDLLGFGLSSHPNHKEFTYTFDNLAYYIDLFLKKLNINKFSMYVFDYGAPIGFRLALKNPDKIMGIISQNGNAYKEGLSEEWNPIRKYWEDKTQHNRDNLRFLLTQEITKWQYTYGVSDIGLLPPDGYNLDQYFLNKEGSLDIQLDLFGDYASNVDLYPDFQDYFRVCQPPFLAVWGKNDPFFLPIGAELFKKDMEHAIIKFYDTGHFALETHVVEIGHEILSFLKKIE